MQIEGGRSAKPNVFGRGSALREWFVPPIVVPALLVVILLLYIGLRGGAV